jgi:serine/threonine protein kinase
MSLFNFSEVRWKPGDVFGRTGLVVLDVRLGGMGIVYVVVNPVDRSQIYAVKTFRDEFIKEERAIKRFWFEAQNWIELEKHENLVFADHIFEIEGKPYIYLEYVDGGNLRYLMKAQRLNLSQILNFAIQFCTGMEAVRKTKRLVHRDIKPENCLITRKGILKITDWGLAKVFDEAPHSSFSKLNFPSVHNTTFTLTKAGVIVGTPLYMPPEQWEGEKADIKSDIYSFGCTLYEMLAGRPPFESSDINKLKISHLEEEPEPIFNISKELNFIVIKCLHKKPEARFVNFEDLGEAILECSEFLEKNRTISQRVEEGWYRLTSEELTSKGFGLLHLRRDREAIRYFKKAVELNPNNYVALGYMGYCFGNVNEHENAIEVCEKAIKINPGFAHAYGNLGYSYSKLNQFEKAIENYKRAIQLESHDVTHYNNITIAYMDWGDYARDLKKYEEGVHYADLGLKIDSRYYRLWANRGVCLEKLRRYREAIDSFKKARSINLRAQQAIVGLYRCYKELGEDRKAEEYLRLALEIDPNFIT